MPEQSMTSTPAVINATHLGGSLTCETFLAESQDGDPMGWGVPRWVERDFRSYLRCGILAHGFARVRCTDCGHDRLLAFSCKGRGVCPSCNARRMAKVAAHLTDEVIPHLPVRQWVLSVPKRLRPFLHQTPEVASAVLAIFLRALRAALRETSPGAPVALRDAQLGAISFPQRFGSSLNPHYHYHVLGLDGVVSGDSERGVQFHEAIGLEAQDAQALARTVQLRVLRWFARRGLLDPSTAADMRTWQGSGGFSVDGSVRIEGEDRAGLERLVRYCARGPLAPNARLRSTVVSIGRPVPDGVPGDVGPPPSSDHVRHPVAPPSPSRQTGPSSTQAATPRSRSSRMLWAQLLARIGSGFCPIPVYRLRLAPDESVS
jgi:hypothetical protein